MKSIFRAIIASASLLLLLVSCSRILEPLYIHLPGTQWCYDQDGKRAFVQFGADGKASVLQKTLLTGSVMQNNGTYTASGHSVIITCSDGTTFNLIRTFSNLKTSKNKNMTRFFPETYDTMAGKVWVGLDLGAMFVYYFKDGENLVRASFTVTQFEEGIPYGWRFETIPYTLSGYNFLAGGKTGWLFSETLFADGIWHTTYPAPQGGSGSSELAGSIWMNRNGSSLLAGLIVFDSGYTFTRIQMEGKTVFSLERGTYSQSGNVLTMKLNDLQDVCTISDNTFRFMERGYGLAD